MTPTKAPKLVARDLSVTYAGKVALRTVSMPLADQQVTALIGPSGCGKSTFLRALNRMHDLVPEASVTGSVLLDGVDILRPDVDAVEVRRRIGMVFQKSTPFPKSIRDNVVFGLRLAGERSRAILDARVESALTAAALWDEVKDRLDDSALGLSGGQQQRLCIARAIAIDPEVLLLDEPASALDPIATERVEELILTLRARFAVVIVTHSLAQARRISDTTAFFYMGELVEAGPTESLFESPRMDRTREYVSGRFG